MGATEDRLLDVWCQQGKPQDAGGIAGPGDSLVGGKLLNAIVLTIGKPAVPPVGPDQGVDQRDIRPRVAVRVHRLVGGERMVLRPEWRPSWAGVVPHLF